MEIFWFVVLALVVGGLIAYGVWYWRLTPKEREAHRESMRRDIQEAETKKREKAEAAQSARNALREGDRVKVTGTRWKGMTGQIMSLSTWQEKALVNFDSNDFTGDVEKVPLKKLKKISW